MSKKNIWKSKYKKGFKKVIQRVKKTYKKIISTINNKVVKPISKSFNWYEDRFIKNKYKQPIDTFFKEWIDESRTTKVIPTDRLKDSYIVKETFDQLIKLSNKRIEVGWKVKWGYIQMPDLTYSINRLINIAINDELEVGHFEDNNYQLFDELLNLIEDYYNNDFYDTDVNGKDFKLNSIIKTFNKICSNNKVAQVSAVTPVRYK